VARLWAITRHAARSILSALRYRKAFANRIPRGSSMITAALTCAASFGLPECDIRPFTAALYRSVVAAVSRDGECGNSTTGRRSASSACNVRVQRNGSAMIYLPALAGVPDGLLYLGDRTL
jgi:hypothetical protein